MNIQIVTLNTPASDITYLEPLMSLVDRVAVANAAPLAYAHGRDFFARNLSGATINQLAFDGDNIVGYAALRTMHPWPDYLDPCEYPTQECALMLFNLVDPQYRGQGIGKQLSKARIASAKNAGFRHLFVTVHPDNAPSIRILDGLGFTFIAQKPMFSNQLMRNLMSLNLYSEAFSA